MYKRQDAKLENGVEYRLIVAINLGILNDFIKNYEAEYTILKEYVDKQGLFDNIPAWKFKLMESKVDDTKPYFYGHVDFTSFHRYDINPSGIDMTFMKELLEKIVSDCSENDIYNKYHSVCMSCKRKDNCPVYWNYKGLVENVKLREYIINVLTKSIIKRNLAPSVR